MASEKSRSAVERRLARRFDRISRRRRPALRELFGDDEAAAILDRARREYRRLLPEVAAIERGLMNAALAGTYEYLAYYKALRSGGHSLEEIGGFFQQSFRSLVDRYPAWLLRLAYRLARPWLRSRLRREAAGSRQHDGPASWRFDFVEGEEGGFGFGFDVANCAVCAAFGRHDASEVVPYLCALDDEMSEVLGMGLRRSGTRALGSSCCDFRYGAAQPEPLRSRHSLPVVSASSRNRRAAGG